MVYFIILDWDQLNQLTRTSTVLCIIAFVISHCCLFLLVSWNKINTRPVPENLSDADKYDKHFKKSPFIKRMGYDEFI